MTPQEAFKILTNTPIRAKGNHIEYSKALHLAMAALQKQIPGKANISIKGTTGWNTTSLCPNCRSFISSGKYCVHCGQALDWGGLL